MVTKKDSSRKRPAQITVALRFIAGAYLIYLASCLLQEYVKPAGGGQMLQIISALLFAVTGAALAGWSFQKFIKREYIRYGGLPDEEEDLPDADNEEANEYDSSEKL